MAEAAISAKQAHTGGITGNYYCLHCANPTAGGVKFCCPGCEAAYSASREIAAAIADNRQKLSGFSAFALKNDDDGSYSLTLTVTGMHCASCIKLIETTLHKEKDVISARVNMTTGRLVVSWRGEAERGDELAHMVANLGYAVKPFNQDSAADFNNSTDNEKLLLRSMAVAGFAMGNIMMLSIGLWSSSAETMGVLTRDLFHWISALIALPAIIYAGRPFFSSALKVLRQGRANMDVPISLAIILTGAMSLYETANSGEYIYFDSAVMLLFFLLIGRYLDVRAKGKARESARNLLSLLHGTATVIREGRQATIPICELREDMLVVVAAGENIPADGVISGGSSEIDMSMISGETIPVSVSRGDNVFAGTVNMQQPLQVRVTKTSDNSLLSEIIRLMEQAEQGQSRYVRLADRAARIYTPIVHSAGAATFIGWWWLMGYGWQASLLNAITVLIITCPCALGLAVPVVQVLASTKLMKKGILLKSGDALEKLAAIDTVIFDKTGTLTIGKAELSGGNYNDKDIKLAASIAAHSKHPLSRAILRAYSGDLLLPEHIEEIAGKGLQAYIAGKRVRLGSRSWCSNDNSNINSNDNNNDDDATTGPELWLNVEGSARAVMFEFTDKLREDAKATVTRLQNAGIKTILLSGDRKQAVQHMARECGIDDYRAQLSPQDKFRYLEKLKKRGKNILMVGDGLNDAPALALADASISPATAMDITQNAADIVFQGNRLAPVVTAWKTAQYSRRLVKQNFTLTVIYNIVAVPLAVMGFVTPLVAAVAMSSSSLLVIGNSFRLNLIADETGESV